MTETKPVLRINFINQSGTDVKIDVETMDAIKYRELLTKTPANAPDNPDAEDCGPGRFTLTVPAGRFFGFMTEFPVKISNPSPQLVSMIAASGKDPWPRPPPPPPPALGGVHDYDTRYTFFNLVEGPPDGPRSVPMTLAPLPEP